MTGMDWLRWYHGTVTDPKWRFIAGEAGVKVGEVVAVWSCMVEYASQATPRGTLTGWRDRVFAMLLDMDPDTLIAIKEQMQGLVLDGDKLTGWEKRQPKYDATAAERKRKQRERLEAATENPVDVGSHGDVTLGHAPSRNVTTDKSRREEITTLSSSDEPNIDRVREVFDYWRTRCGHDKATLTPERREKIKARLRTFSVEQLKGAVDAAAQSPFHQGENDRNTRFDFPETIFKNDASAERLILGARRPSGADRVRVLAPGEVFQ